MCGTLSLSLTSLPSIPAIQSRHQYRDYFVPMATVDAKIGGERENPPIPRPARIGRGNRASVDELNFSQRFEDTVLELTLVKVRFRLGPKAHISLAGHIGEVRDHVPCVLDLV